MKNEIDKKEVVETVKEKEEKMVVGEKVVKD